MRPNWLILFDIHTYIYYIYICIYIYIHIYSLVTVANSDKQWLIC
jgi:hypothetical protein